MATVKLDKLKAKRTTLRSSVSKLETKVLKVIESDSIEYQELRVLRIQVNEKQNQLDIVNKEIEDIIDIQDLEKEVEDSEKWSEKLIRIKCQIESKIESCSQNISDVKKQDEISIPVSKQSVNLPKFDLPHFNGSLEEWLNFKQIFISTIHENSDLSDLQKLQYLKAAVVGSASKLIKGFPIAESSYKEAWATLISRFDNKRNLAYAQLNKFFNAKAIKPNCRKSILELLDNCNEAVRNLKCLDFQFNPFVDLILGYNIQSKLDDSLKRQFELGLDNDHFPSYDELILFLEKQARSLQDVSETYAKSENKLKPIFKRSVSNIVMSNSNVKLNEVNCPDCLDSHALFKCPQFLKKSVTDRWNFVKAKKLCINCLRGNHFISKCLISKKCNICNSKHHTLLHLHEKESFNSVPVQSNNVTQDQSIVNSSCLTTTQNNCQTLLSTAMVLVKSNSGEFIFCRAMVDSGSQKSLISNSCVKKLGLPVKSTNHRISGINNIVAETALSEVDILLKSYYSNEVFDVNALIVNNVTANLPNFVVRKSSWPHLEGLNLADPKFYVSRPVEILLGADLFPLIVLGQSILGPKGTPCALNSRLGWLLTGVIFSKPAQDSNTIVSCHATVQLTHDLQKFWEIESLPDVTPIHVSEENYIKTVQRTESGRYMVDLPFKGTPNLGDSQTNALKRFYLLESKLNKDSELKEQYHAFMQEYLDLNHMEQVPHSHLACENCFYLPHHGVLKEDSTTTKLRVVFDASAKGSSGHSLNDFLEIGPKLQPDLFKILLKFRSYPIALTGDIAKMYRQILVNPRHTDFQRIFWRFQPHESVTSFRLLTVTYGTACAPFLAIRTLHQLAKDYKSEFPTAAQSILENFYVDDFLGGSDSIDAAKQLVTDLNHVLSQGGFTLRKWASNIPSVLENLSEDLKSIKQNVTFLEDSSQKILGLVWNSKEDILRIHINTVKAVHTKRDLLSMIAQIFDPFGIIAPTTIMLKIMMQELWKDKCAWDDKIPDSILKNWQDFRSQIELLKSIRIPRFLNCQALSEHHLEIHGFCDGSGKAYAAVVYLRTISALGEISVNFVAAKTKVNPLKHVTLPRIELCAALLLSQLCSAILESLPFHVNKIYLWSDSQIALTWIESPPVKGNQFVTNRAHRIKSLVPQAVWTYIKGYSNPADCASRGILPRTLLNHKLWWHGPEWLSANVKLPLFFIKSPTVSSETYTDNLSHVAAVTNKSFPEFLLKFSCFSRLCRVLVWCLRFIHNLRQSNSNSRHTGTVSASELSNAINIILKLIQEQEFATELNLLKKNQPLPSNSKYLSLNVFLDNQGLIRVGGRLSKHLSFSHDQKYPVLLPKTHRITRLIVEQYHKRNFHAGAQLVLSLLRQKYWILNGRSFIRKIINECILCKRLKKQACQQLMGDLPVERITPTRPFSKVGLDFAGPITTKPNVPRSKTKLKSYICVFICMSTKAVHLEAVSDLSSSAFLASLRRFVSRRGLPSDIYSDNGKNFKGVANHIKQLFQIIRSEDIQNFSTSNFINWHFIPPYAPHFGGIWEAAVKLTKNHLMKACKTTILNFEELTTLLCQIEACLNSRPLIPLSSDPSDVRALTPGHFLIGVPLLEIPERDNSQNLSLSSRWVLIQRMKQEFWKRWSRDYLHHLQNRPKWITQHTNLQIGDLVVIHDPQTLPLHWRLGRVTRIYPGSDNRVRVVSIFTQDGEIQRPISRVTLVLPAGENV